MCLLVLLSPFELLAFLQFICCKLLLSFWSVSADLFRLAFYLAFSVFSLWTMCASHFNISHFMTSSPLDSSWIFQHCHFVHVLPFIMCSLFHIYAIFEKKHELRFNSLRTPVQQNGQDPGLLQIFRNSSSCTSWIICRAFTSWCCGCCQCRSIEALSKVCLQQGHTVIQQSSPLHWCKRINKNKKHITFTLKNMRNLHPKSTAISTSAVLLLCCISVVFGPWVAHVEVATVVCVQDGLQFAGAALSHFTQCSNSKPFSSRQIDLANCKGVEAGQCRTADFIEIEISTVPARLDRHLANVFSSCFFQATNDIGSRVSQDLLGKIHLSHHHTVNKRHWKHVCSFLCTHKTTNRVHTRKKLWAYAESTMSVEGKKLILGLFAGEQESDRKKLPEMSRSCQSVLWGWLPQQQPPSPQY